MKTVEELYHKASSYTMSLKLNPRQLSVTHSIRNGHHIFSFCYHNTVFSVSNFETLDKKIDEFFKNGEYKNQK